MALARARTRDRQASALYRIDPTPTPTLLISPEKDNIELKLPSSPLASDTVRSAAPPWACWRAGAGIANALETIVDRQFTAAPCLDTRTVTDVDHINTTCKRQRQPCSSDRPATRSRG